MNRCFFSLITLLLFIATVSLQAQIPRTLSYQGVLTDTAGTPKPDGSYDLVFRIYDVASGGTALWSESETVTTKRGLFSSILGDGTAFPSSMNFNEQYWLSIQVDALPELSPRIPLTAVGYSMHSISADTAYVTVTSVSDTLWKRSGSNIYRATGNVGIGTNNPLAKLDVFTPEGTLPLYLNQFANHTYTPTMIQMADAQGIVGIIGVLSASGELGMIGNNSLSLKTGSGYGNFGIHINNTGNVGIGTSSPQKRLHIFGDNVPQFRIEASNGYCELWGGLNFHIITGTEHRFFVDGTNGNIGIGTIPPAYKLDVNGDLNLAAGSVYRIGGVAQTGSSKWTQGSGENIYRLNGYVGIGTTSPTEHLSIRGSALWGTALALTDTNNNVVVDIRAMGNQHIGAIGTSTYNDFTISSNGIGRINLTKDGDIGIGTYNQTNPKMFVSGSSGNVGIGTTTPGYKLDVNGDLNLAAGSVYRIGGVAQTGSSKWTAGTGDNIYRLNSNVGIGTSSPEEEIHIAGFSDVPSDSRPRIRIENLNTSGDNGTALGFEGRNSFFAIGTDYLRDGSNNYYVWDGINNAQRFFIDESGNVGIGTTAPGYKLDVIGTAQATAFNEDGILLADKYAARFHIHSISNVTNLQTELDDLQQQITNTASKWIQSGGDNIYRLNGNVGIGTTNPQRRLHILTDEAPQLRLEQSNGYTELWGGLNFHIVTGTEHRLFIDGTTGNIGVGMTSPPATLSIKVGGTTLADAWSIRSSRRWKTQIEPLQNPLEKVEKLQGVSFKWKENGKSDIGLIAEEVGEIVPEVVTYEENGIDAKSVDYAKLVAVLIEAMKEQQKQIDELKAAMNSLSLNTAE